MILCPSQKDEEHLLYLLAADVLAFRTYFPTSTRVPFTT